LILIGGACTGGTQNLVNPYISEFYPREIRTTGLSMAVGIGRIGSIAAPLIVGFLLVHFAPMQSFAAFGIPSIFGAIAFVCIQEKHGHFEVIPQTKKQAV